MFDSQPIQHDVMELSIGLEGKYNDRFTNCFSRDVNETGQLGGWKFVSLTIKFIYFHHFTYSSVLVFSVQAGESLQSPITKSSV